MASLNALDTRLSLGCYQQYRDNVATLRLLGMPPLDPDQVLSVVSVAPLSLVLPVAAARHHFQLQNELSLSLSRRHYCLQHCDIPAALAE